MIAITYPSGTVVLRSPEIGDIRRLHTNSESRYTIAGEPKTCDYWPDLQVRSFTIRALTANQVSDFKQMMNLSAGQQVTILDYNDELWLGVILTDQLDIVTMRDNCWYDISFEFLGKYIGVPATLKNDTDSQVFTEDGSAVKVI